MVKSCRVGRAFSSPTRASCNRFCIFLTVILNWNSTPGDLIWVVEAKRTVVPLGDTRTFPPFVGFFFFFFNLLYLVGCRFSYGQRVISLEVNFASSQLNHQAYETLWCTQHSSQKCVWKILLIFDQKNIWLYKCLDDRVNNNIRT